MTNPATSTKRADAKRNHAILLAAAREVFAEEGLEASLSLVVERSGLGRGSLYRHFPNRLVLVSAIFEENFSELETLAKSLETAPDRFRRVFWRLIEQLIEARGFVTLLLSDHSKQLPFRNHQARLQTLLSDLVTVAHERKQLPPTFDTQNLALAINLLAGLVSHHPQENLDTIVKESVTLMGLAEWVL